MEKYLKQNTRSNLRRSRPQSLSARYTHNCEWTRCDVILRNTIHVRDLCDLNCYCNTNVSYNSVKRGKEKNRLSSNSTSIDRRLSMPFFWYEKSHWITPPAQSGVEGSIRLLLTKNQVTSQVQSISFERFPRPFSPSGNIVNYIIGKFNMERVPVWPPKFSTTWKDWLIDFRASNSR